MRSTSFSQMVQKEKDKAIGAKLIGEPAKEFLKVENYTERKREGSQEGSRPGSDGTVSTVIASGRQVGQQGAVLSAHREPEGVRLSMLV